MGPPAFYKDKTGIDDTDRRSGQYGNHWLTPIFSSGRSVAEMMPYKSVSAVTCGFSGNGTISRYLFLYYLTKTLIFSKENNLQEKNEIFPES